MLQEGNPEGNSMDRKSEVATEHSENLSLDGSEQRNGHAVARSGGGFRVIASVVQLSISLLLAMFLVALQWTTASAQRLCRAFSSVSEHFDLIGMNLLAILLCALQLTPGLAHTMCNDAFGSIKKHFDLIGFISAFKTAAATKTLTYSALNDDLLYVTGHIGPGSLSVTAALFEATEFSMLRQFALGGTGDAYELVQMGCPDGLRYIGLKSNTECPVTNVVGASIVREHASLWKTKIKELTDQDRDQEAGVVPKTGERVGREAGREVKVIVLEVATTRKQDVGRADEGKKAKQEGRVVLPVKMVSALVLGLLPFLLTIGVIVRCFMCKQKFVGGLITWGTFAMMLAVLGLRYCFAFKYATPKVAAGAPPGDCLVVDERDANILHIIQGAEKDIQALFQRKIDYEASVGKYVLALAGFMFYVYVIVSVLSLPCVPLTGQILYVVANLIGLIADMGKASQNVKLGLAKNACERFQIDFKKFLVFKNRTAAVAFVAKQTNDCSMLESKKLLPCDGPVWKEWWADLAQKCGNRSDEAANKELLKRLRVDMDDGIAQAKLFSSQQSI